VSWCSILLKPLRLRKSLLISKSWANHSEEMQNSFSLSMLFKKVWTYDVIFKNICPNINRPLSLKFLASLPMKILNGIIMIIMSINAFSIIEYGFIRKEHFCDKMWVSLNLIQSSVIKLKALLKIPRF